MALDFKQNIKLQCPFLPEQNRGLGKERWLGNGKKSEISLKVRMYRANLGPQNIQKEIPLLCLLLEFLQKDTSVSSLIFFPPPPQATAVKYCRTQLWSAGGSHCLSVSPGTFNKRMEERISSCSRIASSENAIKPLLPFRASNGKSVWDIGTKASHVSK